MILLFALSNKLHRAFLKEISDKSFRRGVRSFFKIEFIHFLYAKVVSNHSSNQINTKFVQN